MPRKLQKRSGPIKVAIYTRFSSVLQNDTSTEDQIRECREAAEERGWIVLDEYTRSDEAKTGRSLFGRDGLEELVRLAQRKDCPFDGVVMYETSRLARNVADSVKLVDILKYSEKFLFFVTKELDSRAKHFRSIFIDNASKDEDSSEDTGTRVHRSQRGRVLKGLVASGHKYGYKNVPVPAADGAKWRHGRAARDGVRREVIPEQRDVINRMLTMCKSGLGARVIARNLNDSGTPSPGKLLGWPSAAWNTTTVTSILGDETYIGRHTWNKKKQVINPITGRREFKPHPEEEWECVDVPEWRIVSDELWEAAQRERERRRGRTGRRSGGLNRTGASRAYLFSGCLLCETCGSPFISFRTAKDQVRYCCSGYRTGQCSNNLSIFMPILDAQLLPAIADRLHDPSLLERMVRECCDALDSRWKEQCASIAETKGSLEELREKEDKLTRMSNNILDTIQDCGRTLRLSQRLQEVEKELKLVTESLKLASEVASPPPPEEETRALISRKLEEFDSAISSGCEALKHTLALHIDKLNMKPLDTAEGRRYEVSGDIRVFPEGDPEDVLLACSIQRTCKQYTPLSFSFKASLIVSAKEWGKRSQSVETRQKIGDANRMRWAERKKAKAAV